MDNPVSSSFPCGVSVQSMDREALGDFVANWLWEVPFEATPDKAEALRLVREIKARDDAPLCREILDSCSDYLRCFDPPSSVGKKGRVSGFEGPR